MLAQVEITSQKGTKLVLPFRDVADGYFTKDIDGLDPVDATFISSTAAQLEGEIYQAATRGKRNIVLKLVLEPDYLTQTVDSMRTALYEYFMPKSVVQMRFVFDDKEAVTIEGRVERMSSPKFVQEPTVEVSILCFKPDFRALSVTGYSGSSTAGSTKKQIDYIGTSDAPIVFKLLANRSISEVTLYHTRPDGQIDTMNLEVALVSGDTLIVDTTPGEGGRLIQKKTSGGTLSSVMYALQPGSKWPLVRPGTNLFRILISGTTVPYTIEFTNLYGGI